ncbi:hypothetical protein JOC28_000800, partial [Streptococcus loxodontisalivarius]
MFNKHNFEKELKFSIRKFSVGVGSVVIGALLFLSPQALADEVSATTSEAVVTATVADSSQSTSAASELTATTVASQESALSLASSNVADASTDTTVQASEAPQAAEEATVAASATASQEVSDSAETPVAAVAATTSAATSDTRSYATSGTWELTDAFPSSVQNQNVAADFQGEAYQSAQTTVTRDDNTTITVTATIAPADGVQAGVGLLTNGANQSSYRATSDMFVGTPNPSTLPALGVYTQSAPLEDDENVIDKMNYSGKKAISILTLTFSQEVTDPIIDLSGIGGNGRITFNDYIYNTSTMRYDAVPLYARGSFNSTYFELLSSDVTLEKASEGVNLTVTSNSIDVTDKNTYFRSVVDPTDDDFYDTSDRTPDVSPAGTGSIRLKGTFTQVQFKLYHQSTPFTAFSQEEYNTGSDYFKTDVAVRDTLITPDATNGANKHYYTIIDEDLADNNEFSNDDLLRLSVRLENPRGSVIVNYVDTEGNIIGTEYKDTTDAAVGTAYNTAESAGDVDSTATVERPATITKDGKTYELVAEATTATVGTINADGTLAANAGSFTYGTDAASGEVTEGTKSVTYVYKLKEEAKGSVIVNYVDTEGNIIGTEYKDTTDAAVGTAYNTAESAGDVDSTATVERPATITKDGKTYELVAEATTATVGTVNADGTLASNAGSFTYGTDAASGEVTEGTKSVTYVYKEVVKTGNVTARYVIEGTETEIADDKAVKTDAPVDEAYSDEAPAEITGKDGKVYVLSTTAPVRQNEGDAPASGTVTEADQTITYQYVLKTTETETVTTKEGNVVVHYVTEDGTTLQADVEDTPATIVEVTTTKTTVDSDGETVGTPTVTTEVTEVPYDTTDNKPAEITVDGKTYVLVGTAVETSDGATQLIDGKVVTAETTSEEQGTVVEGTTEVTYVYKLKEEAKGSVIVNYVDTEGNVIGTEYKDTTDAAVGTAYNTAESAGDVDSTATVERPATITKDGKTYELVAEATTATVGTVNADGTLASNAGSFTYGTDAASGEVTEGTKSVTYVYKEVVKTGNVVARYVIEGTETEIADDKAVKTDAPVDEAYSDEAPAEITGKDGKVYVLSTTAPVRQNEGDAPASGTVTEADQTITYQYVLKTTEEETTTTTSGNVIVHYVTEDGETLQDDVEDTPETVVSTTVTKTVVDSDGDTVGTPTTTTTESGTTYDTTDNKPTTITKDSKTYELVPTKTVGNETGTVVEGTTEVTYVYKLKEEAKGSVVVNYVDTEGNVIGTEYKDTTDAAVGTAYNTAESAGDVDSTATVERPATITKDGKTYELVAEATTATVGTVNADGTLAANAGSFTYGTDAASGEVTEGTKSVTYVYKEVVKTGNVTARYVIEGTETEIADDKSVKTDAPVDEAYSDRAPATIVKDGKTYEFVSVRTNEGDAPANGTVTEGTQTITYEYIEIPKGRVIVDYVIEGTDTQLKDTYEDTAETYIRDSEGNPITYDTAENTTEKPSFIEKDGVQYELVSVKSGSDSESGDLREGTLHVTYEYRKVETPQGNVVVNYVDESGNVIKDPVVDTPTSDVDTPYDTTDNKPTTIEFNGKTYELVPTKTVGNETGTVVEGTTEVTYVYKEVVKTGNVVARYVIEGTETEIADGKSVKTDALVDEAYSDEAPAEITKDGVTYELVRTRANEGDAPADGTVTEATQTITYEYKVKETPATPQGNVVVNYVDESGNVIKDPVVDTPTSDVDTPYDTTDNKPTTIEFNGKTYELVPTKTVGNETGTVVEGTTEVTYVYKEVVKTGNVVARYVIEGTETEIADDKSVKTDAPVDEAYSDEAPTEITKDGVTYELVGTRTNDGDAPADGTVTEATQTITYEYKVKETPATPTGNVVVNYVDESGNVIKDPVVDTPTSDVDTPYDTTDNKPTTIEFNGKTYELVPTKTVGNETGTVVEGTTEVTYVYKEVVKTGNVVARYVIEGTETEISDDKSVKTDAPVDEAYSDEAPAEITKDGVTYELVRTRANEGEAPADGTVTEATQTITYEYKVKETPATPTGNVVVNYVDESGNVIKDPVVDTPTSDVDTPYDTTDNKPTTIEFNGKIYELVPTKTVGNENGTVVEGTTEVTYVYKEVIKTGNVVARYVIEGTETEIADDKSVKTDAPVDEAYSDEAPAEITKDGVTYELVRTRADEGDAPADGTVTKSTQTITYEYKIKETPETPQGNVVVNYVDESGNVIKDPVVDTPYDTTDNKPTTIEFNGKTYELVPTKTVGNETGTVVEGTTEVTYVYREVVTPTPVTPQGNVVVNYVDESGNVIKDPVVDTPTSDVDTPYDTTDNKPTTIEFNGKTYELVPTKTVGSETGTVVEGTTEVTYVYREVVTPTPVTPQGNVVVNYVDESGNVIKDPVVDTPTSDVDTPYDTTDNKPTIIDFNGKTYELVPNKTVGNETGTVVEGTTEVTYVYKEVVKTGNVVARYVIEGTETEIADDKAVKTDAPVDEAYSDQAPAEITKDGVTYELVRTRADEGDAAADGTVTEATQTITYEYKVKETPATPTGNVVARYVIEGTETEIADDKAVKTDAPVDEAYSDEAPAEITKDGVTYELVRTRANEGDAAADGTVTEATQTITYEYKVKETPTTLTGNVVARYVIEGTETEIADDKSVKTDAPVDEAYSDEAPAEITKDGVTYELVRTRANEGDAPADGTVTEATQTITYEYKVKETPVTPTGNVVVNYVDESGNVIKDPVVDTPTSDVDTPYDTTDNKPTTIEFNGKTYELVPTKTVGNETGTVVEGTTEVTYVYKEVVKTGNVVARYVIEGTETEIADDKSVKTDAPVDEAYSDEAPAEITKDGVTYELVRTRANEGDAPADGTVTEATQTITYEYKVKETPATPTGNVVARYVIEGTETEIADDKSVKTDAPVDEAYSDEAPAEITKDGVTYELVRTRANEG